MSLTLSETSSGILYGEHKRGHAPMVEIAPEKVSGQHILKRGSLMRELHYPAYSLLLVGGLPGAGKSTLINRCVETPDDESAVCLSVAKMVEADGGSMTDVTQRALSEAYTRMLEVAAEAPTAVPVVIEATSFHSGMRTDIRDLAGEWGREAHLLMIQATAKQAASGLQARGYHLSDEIWKHYVGQATAFDHILQIDPDHLIDEEWHSILLSSRYAAGKISAIAFDAE